MNLCDTCRLNAEGCLLDAPRETDLCYEHRPLDLAAYDRAVAHHAAGSIRSPVRDEVARAHWRCLTRLIEAGAEMAA